MTKRRKVRASLGAKVLGNVDRYFNNELATIAIELLQNARRAGARAVSVTTRPGLDRIIVADDGTGMTSSEAATLLTFGGSSNPDVVEHDEGPAGMGFFCLAHRGPQVRSRDWSMRLDALVFCGYRDAEIETGLDPIAGTVVTFEADLQHWHDRDEATEAFRAAARFLPIDVTIDGFAAPRARLDNWLAPAPEIGGDGAYGATVDVASAMVGDCSLAVARFELGQLRWRLRGEPTDPSAADEDWLAVYLDVFGHVLKVPEHVLHHCAPITVHAPEGGIVLLSGDGAMAGPVTPGYVAIVEVLGQGVVRTRLPDRKEVVVTPELEALVRLIVDLVADLAGRAKRNGADARGWVRMLARKGDVDVPEAQVVSLRGALDAERGFLMGPPRRRGSAMLAALAEDGEIVYRQPSATLDASSLQVVDAEKILEDAILRRPVEGLPLLASRRGALPDVDRATSATLVVDDRRIPLGLDPLTGARRAEAPSDAWPQRTALVPTLEIAFETAEGRSPVLPIDFVVTAGRDHEGLPVILTRREASIAAIVEEAVPPWTDELPDSRRVATMLRRRLTTLMRSEAQTVAEILSDALTESEGQGLLNETVVAIRILPGGRIEVTMSDGSVATAGCGEQIPRKAAVATAKRRRSRPGCGSDL